MNKLIMGVMGDSCKFISQKVWERGSPVAEFDTTVFWF